MIKNGLAVLTLALIATLAHADDYLSPTNERVRLSLGVVRLSTTTGIRLNGSQGVSGTSRQAENDFGLDRSDFEPKFQAMVRVHERHRLRFDYFTLDRTGNRTLLSPIVFRNVILQVGDPVQTNLSVRSLGITYEYSFIHREKFELAATFGINETDFSARARVFTQTRHVNQTEDQAGPIPTFGLDSTYVISKRFYVDARAQYFRIAVSHVNGSLGFYELAALYRYRPNVAFGLGYTAAKATMTSRRRNNLACFNLDSQGPELF